MQRMLLLLVPWGHPTLGEAAHIRMSRHQAIRMKPILSKATKESSYRYD